MERTRAMESWIIDDTGFSIANHGAGPLIDWLYLPEDGQGRPRSARMTEFPHSSAWPISPNCVGASSVTIRNSKKRWDLGFTKARMAWVPPSRDAVYRVLRIPDLRVISERETILPSGSHYSALFAQPAIPHGYRPGGGPRSEPSITSD
jgi:hypothetical protein